MHVLVTGGHGFIGTHLVRRLLDEGAAVRCLVRGADRPAALADLDVEIVRGDVRDPGTLGPAVRGVDEIHHLAGLTSALTPGAMRATNTAGTGHLIAAAARAGLGGRFVFCSSLAAVGPSVPGHPHGACPPCRPLTWYGASKLAAERLLGQWTGRVAITVLRPPGVYGPRDAEFLRLFEAAAKGISLVAGPPTKAYSLIHAADLAGAFVAAGRSEQTVGGTYFATHPEVVTLGELVAAAEAAVGRRTRRLRLPESFLRLFGRGVDLASQLTGRSSILGAQRMLELATGDWVCEGTALPAATGWEARIPLAQGFPETAAWYRREGFID